MYFKSKRTSLLILGITAVLCSRIMFVFFNDPEGPNLLIVAVAAAIVYALSLVVYYYPSIKQVGFKRLLLAIFTQVIIVTVSFFSLN